MKMMVKLFTKKANLMQVQSITRLKNPVLMKDTVIA
jgi:hypothetical protein